MNMIKISLLLSLFSLAAWSGSLAAAPATEQAKVEMIDFDSLQPRLQMENDTIYVVNFWATWCAPCVREIPAFEQLYANYKDQNLKVLLVSLDFPNHLESRVMPFLEEHQVKSEVVLLDETNPNRWIPLVDESWTGAIPATIIYSRSFREFYQQEFKYEELEGIILPLL